MTSDTQTSPFLTTEQAGARLQIAPGTLRNWCSRGVGPTPLKIGGAVRYHLDELDRWALAQALEMVVS
jgi:predicted DNA-binding transcriptional regulator AlpA